MPEITIPKSGAVAFRKLIDLQEGEFEALLNAVSNTAPVGDPDVFWKHVSKNVPNIPRETVESIVDELFSLNYARDKWGLPVDDFVKNIVDAVGAESSTKELSSQGETALL